MCVYVDSSDSSYVRVGSTGPSTQVHTQVHTYPGCLLTGARHLDEAYMVLIQHYRTG